MTGKAAAVVADMTVAAAAVAVVGAVVHSRCQFAFFPCSIIAVCVWALARSF